MSVIRQKWSKSYPIIKSRVFPNVVANLHNDEHYNVAGVLDSSTSAGTCITCQRSEKIVYTGGRPGHTRQGSNFCIHTKYSRLYLGDLSQPAYGVSINGSQEKSLYWRYHRNCAEAYHTSAEASFLAAAGVLTGTAVLGVDGQGFINSAIQAVKPDLTKFSLPNDLLDWKQIHSLTKVWDRTRSLVTNAAGAFLNYKFGWKPTIGDLKILNSINKFASLLHKQLEDFRKTTGTIIAARKTMLKDSTVKIGNSNPEADKHLFWRGQVDRTVHAFVVYQPLPVYVLGKYDEALRLVLDGAGFELNPRIVWDKIPFSFVVDWFTNIGDFLDQYKHDALELPISIVDTYLQYKERSQVDSWVNFGPTGGLTYSPKLSSGTVSTSEVFHRLPLRPDLATFAGLKAKWPSPNQAILGVALGAVLNGEKINTFSRSWDPTMNRQSRFFDYL